MSELEKVNVRVGPDIGCGPQELACARGSAVNGRGDCVELGHVLVGPGHKLDLHAVPGLVCSSVPLNKERRALIRKARCQGCYGIRRGSRG